MCVGVDLEGAGQREWIVKFCRETFIDLEAPSHDAGFNFLVRTLNRLLAWFFDGWT